MFIFLLSTSTFAIGSDSSLFLIPVVSVLPWFGLNPVCVVVVLPSTVTIDFVTHFNKLKSKYFTYIYSLSWSSSFSFHLLGIESSSLSLSSEIWALFIIILSEVEGSITSNATFTSLYDGLSSDICLLLSNGLIIFSLVIGYATFPVISSVIFKPFVTSFDFDK